MSSVISQVKKFYRSAVPKSIRHSAPVMWFKRVFLSKVLPHDAMYDREYYERTVEGPAVKASAVMAGSIVSEFEPKSVVDVGCGTGALLAALRDRGCTVFGLEYSQAGIEFCRSRALDVHRFDLESDSLGERRTFDVASSMEVAEHLPERIADRFVDLLVSFAPVIVFTAARPGQGGSDHVNEQPPEYWIEKFRARSFTHDPACAARMSEGWRTSGAVATWYWENLMVFRRERIS
jgi:SAM-dependent methyltransferase